MITDDMPLEIKQFLNTAKNFHKLIRTETEAFMLVIWCPRRRMGQDL